MRKEDRDYLMFEWSDNLQAWIITVDKDARLRIEEINEIVKKDYFVVRVNPKSLH